MTLTRECVIEACLTLLQDKRHALMAAIQQVNEAIAGEQKSTAGDKHEVSKAILQAEQEKLYGQLQALDQQLADTQRLPRVSATEHVGTGSLILTNQGYFFIGCALGKLTADNETVICLSANAPLAKALVGGVVNDVILLNNQQYSIIAIV
ncbi:MAG: hypothetical protein QM534_10305 [Sediminibacterium sp.]|nr:hypothetical protein [Sediminibacterium sp.]